MIENNIEELLHIYDGTLYTHSESDRITFDGKGGFEKRVLILVKKEDMNEENETLLQKMLKACLFEEKDYLVCVITQADVLAAISHFQPETTLLFGLHINSEVFHSQKEMYKPFRFAGRKFLLSHALSDIAINPSNKSLLWTQGLKVLFNIK